MRHTIPKVNWPEALIDTMKAASPGDTVEVHTEDMKQLALRAMGRMGIEGIAIEVEEA